jgi:hypothetical protein
LNEFISWAELRVKNILVGETHNGKEIRSIIY